MCSFLLLISLDERGGEGRAGLVWVGWAGLGWARLGWAGAAGLGRRDVCTNERVRGPFKTLLSRTAFDHRRGCGMQHAPVTCMASE